MDEKTAAESSPSDGPNVIPCPESKEEAQSSTGIHKNAVETEEIATAPPTEKEKHAMNHKTAKQVDQKIETDVGEQRDKQINSTSAAPNDHMNDNPNVAPCPAKLSVKERPLAEGSEITAEEKAAGEKKQQINQTSPSANEKKAPSSSENKSLLGSIIPSSPIRDSTIPSSCNQETAQEWVNEKVTVLDENALDHMYLQQIDDCKSMVEGDTDKKGRALLDLYHLKGIILGLCAENGAFLEDSEKIKQQLYEALKLFVDHDDYATIFQRAIDLDTEGEIGEVEDFLENLTEDKSHSEVYSDTGRKNMQMEEEVTTFIALVKKYLECKKKKSSEVENVKNELVKSFGATKPLGHGIPLQQNIGREICHKAMAQSSEVRELLEAHGDGLGIVEFNKQPGNTTKAVKHALDEAERLGNDFFNAKNAYSKILVLNEAQNYIHESQKSQAKKQRSNAFDNQLVCNAFREFFLMAHDSQKDLFDREGWANMLQPVLSPGPNAVEEEDSKPPAKPARKPSQEPKQAPSIGKASPNRKAKEKRSKKSNSNKEILNAQKIFDIVDKNGYSANLKPKTKLRRIMTLHDLIPEVKKPKNISQKDFFLVIFSQFLSDQETCKAAAHKIKGFAEGLKDLFGFEKEIHEKFKKLNLKPEKSFWNSLAQDAVEEEDECGSINLGDNDSDEEEEESDEEEEIYDSDMIDDTAEETKTNTSEGLAFCMQKMFHYFTLDPKFIDDYFDGALDKDNLKFFLASNLGRKLAEALEKSVTTQNAPLFDFASLGQLNALVTGLVEGASGFSETQGVEPSVEYIKNFTNNTLEINHGFYLLEVVLRRAVKGSAKSECILELSPQDKKYERANYDDQYTVCAVAIGNLIFFSHFKNPVHFQKAFGNVQREKEIFECKKYEILVKPKKIESVQPAVKKILKCFKVVHPSIQKLLWSKDMPIEFYMVQKKGFNSSGPIKIGAKEFFIQNLDHVEESEIALKNHFIKLGDNARAILVAKNPEKARKGILYLVQVRPKLLKYEETSQVEWDEVTSENALDIVLERIKKQGMFS